MKERRVYVRHLLGTNLDGKSGWYDIYEVYTQPRIDHIRFQLYDIWWKLMWKSGIEKVQDRLWNIYMSYRDDPDEWLLPPGAERDCKHYDLSVKNQTVLGSVKVTREKGLL